MLNRSDLLLQNQALVRANHRFLAPKCSKSLDSTRQDKDIEYGREKKGEEGEIVSSVAAIDTCSCLFIGLLTTRASVIHSLRSIHLDGLFSSRQMISILRLVTAASVAHPAWRKYRLASIKSFRQSVVATSLSRSTAVEREPSSYVTSFLGQMNGFGPNF